MFIHLLRIFEVNPKLRKGEKDFVAQLIMLLNKVTNKKQYVLSYTLLLTKQKSEEKNTSTEGM